MPYKRKSSSRRRRNTGLPYGVSAMAKSAARLMAYNRRLQSIADAEDAFGATETFGAGVGSQKIGVGNLMTRRQQAIMRGYGKYGIGKAMRSIGKTAVTAAGKAAMSAAMKYGGGMYTGSGIYTGSGEYAGPDTNGLIASSKSTMDVVPLFADDSDQGICVTRREYVSEIYGPPLNSAGIPEPFALQSFAINPGLEKTFPWLSQIAANYDEYTMNQLIFTFKSTTTESGNTSNGQVGTVIMATNYNAAASNFTDKFTMMQYDKANSSRLTESLQHGVECDPALLSGSHGEYVRTNPVVSNQDLKTYDHGKFQIALANVPLGFQNQSLGELWVTYNVTLRKPKFFTGKGLAISKDIYLSYPTGSETNALPFGTDYLRGQQNNIGCALTFANNQVIVTFPAGYSGYLRILLAMEGTNINPNSASTPIAITSGNIDLVPDLYGPKVGVDDKPQSFLYNITASNGTTNPGTQGFVMEAHINVQIATGGVNNVVTLVVPTHETIVQHYLEISEYNAGFSYAANNISSELAPIWVSHSSAQIIVPS